MAKPTEIVVWFDDGTRFHIDPAAAKSIFTTQGAAAACGHHGPFENPGPQAPVTGPFPGTPGPPSKGGGGGGGGPKNTAAPTSSAALSGSCYYINGVIVCD